MTLARWAPLALLYCACVFIHEPGDGPSDRPRPIETGGELGDSTFEYRCLDLADDACREPRAGAFPALLARGATFGLSVKDASALLFPVSPRRFSSPKRGEFQATLPGVGAIYAQKTRDGDALDFIHFEVREVEGFRLYAKDASPPLEPLVVGGTRALIARPLSQEGLALAGAVVPQWTVSPPEVLVVESTLGMATTIRALAPGEASLTASLGDVSTTFRVIVKEDVP